MRTIVAALMAIVCGGNLQAAPHFHPATEVVLFTPAPADPLAARLEAELAALGIQVRKLPMPPEGELDAAVSREIAAGASAAIRILPHSRGADVWTGETTARMLRPASSGPDTSDAALSVIALRTVEFLRATLLDVKKRPPPAVRTSTAAGRAQGETLREPPAAGERAAPPAVVGSETAPLRPSEVSPAAVPRPGETTPPGAAPPPPAGTAPAAETAAAEVPKPVIPPLKMEPPPEAPSEPIRLEITAGPAWAASPGGISPVTGVAVIGRGRVSEQAGLELMSVFPLVPSELAKPEGTVEVRTALFGAGALFGLASGRRFHADAAVGVSMLMIRASGRPVSEVASAVQTAWRPAAHLRLGAGMDLNRWLSLRADAIGGVAAARTAVGFDVTDSAGSTTSTDYGVWGPAFAVGTIGLQAAW